MAKVYSLKNSTGKMQYLHMQFMLQFNEDLQEHQAGKVNGTGEILHYWHIERKKKRGGWKHVRGIHRTKSQITRIWLDRYNDGEHRLKHMDKIC